MLTPASIDLIFICLALRRRTNRNNTRVNLRLRRWQTDIPLKREVELPQMEDEFIDTEVQCEAA